VSEMRHRSPRFPVRREQIDRRRWGGTAPWPLVAGIDPEPSCICSSSARIEDRDRRVVGKEMVGGEHVFAQSLVQRFQPPARAANPSGQCRAPEIDAMPGKDLRLPIKRLCVPKTLSRFIE
jgi:hypothetical protein